MLHLSITFASAQTQPGTGWTFLFAVGTQNVAHGLKTNEILKLYKLDGQALDGFECVFDSQLIVRCGQLSMCTEANFINSVCYFCLFLLINTWAGRGNKFLKLQNELAFLKCTYACL